METILLKKATIYDRESPHHQEVMDILVKKGKISKIASDVRAQKVDKIIESKHLCVSPGWMDIGSWNGEPGFEHREDLVSLKNAGARGGYAYLAPFPNTNPFIDSRTQVELLLGKNGHHPVQILPIGAVTKGGKGNEISEMLDMQDAGAVAFSDGFCKHLDRNVVLRAMQYLQACNGRLIFDLGSKNDTDGIVHEGEVSVQMGLSGIPTLNEGMNCHTLIELSNYTESYVHLHNISTGVFKRNQKLNRSGRVTYSVPYLNLIRSDKEMLGFDVMLKVLPPLRDTSTLRKLVKGLKTGMISAINTNHVPINEEDKQLEFSQAKFGAIGLETCFPALNTLVDDLDLETIVHILSSGAYMVLGIKRHSIRKDESAVITIFDPNENISITPQYFASKSKNSPFLGAILKGKIKGVINQQKSLIFE